jgi:hypothetical protein
MVNVNGLSLSQKVLVCKLKQSMWRAGVTDKEVTEETNTRYKASKSAGSYRKRLMSEQLKPVRAAFTDVDKFHKANTAPWNNGQNEGILLVDHYTKYRDGIEEKIRAALDKVDEFVLLYPNHLAQARRDLGGMFNRAEYPLPSEIKGFFSIESDVYPVPDPSDWRVALSDEEVERLRSHFEARMEASLQSSMAAVWQRLYEPVKKMAETLEQDGKQFHGTLVTNILDVLQVLPALNITNDPQLEEMRKEIERRLCGAKAPELKGDPELRMETAKAAKEIMDKLSVFAGGLPN